MFGYPTQKTWRDYLRIRVRSLMLLIGLRDAEVTGGLRHLRNLVGLESRPQRHGGHQFWCQSVEFAGHCQERRDDRR